MLVKKIAIGVTTIAMIMHVSAVQAPEPALVKIVKPVQVVSIDNLVYKYSAQYNVSAELMFKIIRCENRGRIPDLQSYSKYTRDHPEWGVKAGERELSYGISQIHLPSHPRVTYEQAIDPEFSVEFLAKGLVTGIKWSCN